jgi:ribonuclease P protein component
MAPKEGANLSGSSTTKDTGGRFPRSTRLLRHADFERIYKHGRRHFSSQMTVFYLPREKGAGARVGFTVGRVLGAAVDRNRIKRRLREAVRRQRRICSVHVDVVINPKKSLLTAEFSKVLTEVGNAFDVIQQKLAGTQAPRK